jgi:hypothetical protein
VLRTIFGPKGQDVAGGWRRLHNEVLHNLYASPVIKSKRMRWEVICKYMGENINAYKILVRKPERKRPFGRSLRGCEDNVRIDLVNWIRVARDSNQW